MKPTQLPRRSVDVLFNEREILEAAHSIGVNELQLALTILTAACLRRGHVSDVARLREKNRLLLALRTEDGSAGLLRQLPEKAEALIRRA